MMSVDIARPSPPLRKLFSVDHSTEEHFQCQQDCQFYGAYGHLRAKLDYSYHCHYRKERQWLHDSIIEDFLENSFRSRSGTPSTPCIPWLILTVGARGAGKRHTIRELVDQDRLRLLSYVSVDSDEIRLMLPEFNSYNEQSPDMVDVFTKKECSYICETLTLAALQAGKNVIYDTSLQDGEWFVTYIGKLREERPNLKIAMLHVTADLEVVLKRARHRGRETGRLIPDQQIAQSYHHLPFSVEIVRPVVDYFCVLLNQTKPEIQGDTWDHFRETFDQTALLAKPPPRLSRIDTEELNAARKSVVRKRFSVMISSEENHKTDEMKFYGQFAHIRKTLDYSYHQNYTFERQIFQDAVINEFLKSAIVRDKNGELCTTPTEPWIVFTAGAMGAGKSYTMRKLVKKGRFPLIAFVRVDPDEIRRYLPEFHLYIKQSPELAGELTRKESGFIAEILTLAGLQAGKNVMVDGSLRDSDWYQTYFHRLRTEFPILRLSIIHVSAPRAAVLQRAADRAAVTGRIVPRDLLLASLEQVPRSVGILAPLVDYHVELNNAPHTADIEIVTPGITWDSFQATWIQ